MTKQQKTSAFILAGVAAYALYKFSKLTSEDKAILADKIKTQGKELLNHLNLGSLKNSSVGKNIFEPSNT